MSRNLWGESPKGVHNLDWRHWLDVNIANRERAARAQRAQANTPQPKATNKPHPSLLQSPAPMGDEYYAARARVRQAQDEWQRTVDADPFWNSPYED